MSSPNLKIPKFAVTLTLRPLYYQTHTYKEQYEKCKAVLEVIQDLHPELDMSFVSEPTKLNNCHLHGCVYFKEGKYEPSPMSYINKIFKQEPFGFSYLKPITNEAGWQAYMTKTANCIGII